MQTQKSINELSYQIIGCAIEVHRQLGLSYRTICTTEKGIEQNFSPCSPCLRGK